MNGLWMVKVGHPKEVFLKPIDFHPFWGKQKSWIVWDMIKNAIPSFDSTSIFKMLKTLGNKVFH